VGLLAVSCAATLEIDLVAESVSSSLAEGTPTVVPSGDDPAPTSTVVPTPTPPTPLSYDAAIGAYFTDVERFWGVALPDLFGQAFVPVDRRLPYDPARFESIPGCGGEVGPIELYEGNAFYCSPDDYIAWDDVGLFPDLFATFGDFAVGLVIAHEYGHAVQSRAGLQGRTIFLELQADCFAGAWASSVAAGEGALAPLFDPIDLDDAIGGFLTFADPLGTPAADAAAHGTAFDRLNAFAEGFSNGVGLCGSFLTDPPQTASILIDAADDTGGNMALEALLPQITADIAMVMQQLGQALVEPSFVAPSGFTEFAGPLVPIECGALQVVPQEIDGSAFFCEADAVVYIDRVELEELWLDVGDFAPVYAVAHSYAMSVVAPLVTDPTRAVFAADCLVGVWSRDVFDDASAVDRDPERLVLSAGDLDEGIVGLLLVTATGPSLRDPGSIGTFDRVSSFGAGFFRGADACELD